MRIRLALAVLVALSAVACGEDTKEPPEAGASSTPTQLTGVIIDVESESLTEVKGFTLRSEGETYEILMDSQVNYDFPPSHLNEHVVSGDPVTVDLSDPRRQALRAIRNRRLNLPRPSAHLVALFATDCALVGIVERNQSFFSCALSSSGAIAPSYLAATFPLSSTTKTQGSLGSPHS